MSSTLNYQFSDAELLYRGVDDLYWNDETNEVSSAVFKDEDGASVDRLWDRIEEAAIKRIKRKRFITIIKVSVGDVIESETIAVYKPSTSNKFHSEIHDSSTKILISSRKCDLLTQKSVVVYTRQ